jgi:hypothetical protein
MTMLLQLLKELLAVTDDGAYILCGGCGLCS